MKRSQLWLICACTLVLSIGGIHAVQSLFGNLRQLSDTSRNLATCENLCRRIESLRNSATNAALEQQNKDELTTKIEAGVLNAGISADCLTRINPQSGRRVGKTAYLEEVTEIELQHVTLEQLITLALSVVNDDSAMFVSSLRLSAPRIAIETTSDVWDAEVGLTRLVFSPQSSRSTR
ncbi:MAG: hypothetical protein KDA87_26085 [Planctomycetales bacterium]|nr:hypothetical protein [Planctomycetales bacterium]